MRGQGGYEMSVRCPLGCVIWDKRHQTNAAGGSGHQCQEVARQDRWGTGRGRGSSGARDALSN